MNRFHDFLPLYSLHGKVASCHCKGLGQDNVCEIVYLANFSYFISFLHQFLRFVHLIYSQSSLHTITCLVSAWYWSPLAHCCLFYFSTYLLAPQVFVMSVLIFLRWTWNKHLMFGQERMFRFWLNLGVCPHFFFIGSHFSYSFSFVSITV